MIINHASLLAGWQRYDIAISRERCSPFSGAHEFVILLKHNFGDYDRPSYRIVHSHLYHMSPSPGVDCRESAMCYEEAED